jgi:hypothetical protein
MPFPDPDEIPPREEEPLAEEEPGEGSIVDPLADPPASLGHKARNPYEGSAADAEESLNREDETDDPPATDEQLHEDFP